MLRSKFVLGIFTCIFLGCFIFEYSMTLSETIQNSLNKQFSTDSLLIEIDSLRVQLKEVQQQLRNHRQEYIDLLSSATSISSSNVGNTISFLTLICSIIILILGVFSGAGYFLVLNLLNKQQERYDKKFSQKAKEFEISLEESRGNFYLGVYQFAQARDSFERILTLDPNNYFAHERLGLLYLGDILKQPQKAVVHSRKAIELNPNKLSPYANLQVALIHTKHPFEENEKAFKKLIEMCELLGADDMIYGKAKLFFADELSGKQPTRKDEAKQLYHQAIGHFDKISDEARQKVASVWKANAEKGLSKLEN